MGRIARGLGGGLKRLFFGGKRRAIASTVGMIVVLFLLLNGGGGNRNASATPTPMKVPAAAPTTTLPAKAAPQMVGATPTLPAPLSVEPTLPASVPTLAQNEVLKAAETPVAPSAQTVSEVPPYGAYFCGQWVDPSYIWTWGNNQCADYGKRVDACPNMIGQNPPLGCTDPGSGKPLGVHRFETGWCWYRETSTWTEKGQMAPVPDARIKCDPYGSGTWVAP